MLCNIMVTLSAVQLAPVKPFPILSSEKMLIQSIHGIFLKIAQSKPRIGFCTVFRELFLSEQGKK